MTTARLQLGAAGEAAAERHLRQIGCTILGRNVRLGRLGELDLVALEKDVLAFVEVKSKLACESLGGFVNITEAKQRKLRQLAETYLQRNSHSFKGARFDAIEVEFQSPDDARPVVRHIRDAFR